MLFKERKRQQAMAIAEAGGDSFWTREFSEHARTRVLQAFQGAFALSDDQYAFGASAAQKWESICQQTRRLLCLDMGVGSLRGKSQASEDLGAFLFSADDDEVCSVIEAMWETIIFVGGQNPHWLSSDYFGPALIEALYRERLSYDFIDGRIVEKKSEELHAAVVGPALRLLSGHPGWSSVETAYRNALGEIADGKADDAITDAATALQDAFVLLGCEGNSLGPLIRDARKKGILASHDPALGDAIVKMCDWVSADRSEMGDGHHGASPATRDDAWLTVHVAGALILRLATSPRSSD